MFKSNKKRIFFSVLAICLILVVSVFVAAKPPWLRNTCPIKDDTAVVFYGETGNGGVGDLSRSWIIHFLDWWKQKDPSLSYVELDSSDVISDCNFADFPNLKLYIQPGGNAYYQQKKLGADGRQKIINFIDSGKAYLGICAGFYYAADDYYWQGNYYDWPNLLSRFPTVEGSITDIADYDSEPGYALTSVSNGNKMVYYGGPTRGWKDTPKYFPGEALLNYTDVPGNLPAAIKYNKMLLMSVHAEAFENDGIDGLTTEQRIENYKWLANEINDVAGTNFYVPPYTIPQCSDGIDNDNDGLIDVMDSGCLNSSDNQESNCGDSVCDASLENWQTCSLDCPAPECADGIDNDNDSLVDYPNDPGCVSLNDTSEIDAQEPVVVFSDNFEDGSLNKWTTYGAGVLWSASQDTSYEGVWSARAKKTGAGKDSFMETTINLQDYSSGKLEYYRKLVGLDATDDFEVSYYSGGEWHSLEHLGNSRESDSGFLFKSYSIPTDTTKIRFKCECGAVSEKCYVDKVKVIGE